jgi:glycerophosphoryl diester phosphodiesterase
MQKSNLWSPPFIIAHRGARSIAPENTIAAFQKAINLGADGIECDVHMSSDSVPVVIHDETVDRTTSGSGLVAELTAEQLRAFGVPTLEETLECLPEQAVINVELKGPSLRGAEGDAVIHGAGLLRDARSDEFVNIVRDILKPHKNRLKILISSFDPGLVHPWSEYPTGLLFESAQPFQLPIVWHPDALNLNLELLRQAPPGYRIVLWTAKNLDEARLWIAQGADGVIAEF